MTLQSEAAKAETGVRLKTAADTNNRMLASWQDELTSPANDLEPRGMIIDLNQDTAVPWRGRLTRRATLLQTVVSVRHRRLLPVSMDHFSTDRLSAERLNESHLKDLVALHLDADVSRYLGGVRSAEVTKTYLATSMAHWDQHGFGLWALRTKDGAFAGRAGIRHILVDGIDEIEVAYTFRRELWGQGLASEIATTLTDIGLSQLELPSLIGLVFVEHGASRRVLEKANYLLEKHTTHRGENVVVYRIRR